jgi:hypothetical protein
MEEQCRIHLLIVTMMASIWSMTSISYLPMNAHVLASLFQQEYKVRVTSSNEDTVMQTQAVRLR